MRSTVLLLILLPSLAFAQVYRWVDSDGNVHFSDQPVGSGPSEEVRLRETNRFQAPEITAREPAPRRQRQPTVTFYSATWCGICDRARDYFTDNDIPFNEYDIEETEKGRQDYRDLEGTGVPILLFGDTRLNGFNQQRFEAAYQP